MGTSIAGWFREKPNIDDLGVPLQETPIWLNPVNSKSLILFKLSLQQSRRISSTRFLAATFQFFPGFWCLKISLNYGGLTIQKLGFNLMGFNENLPSGNLKVCYGESSIGKPSKCMSDLGQQNLEILKYVLCHFSVMFCHCFVVWVCHLSFSCHLGVSCVCHVSVSLACSKCGFPTRTRNYRTMLKWQKTQGKARFLTLSSSAANAGHQKNKNHNIYIYIYNRKMTKNYEKTIRCNAKKWQKHGLIWYIHYDPIR